MVYPVLVRIFKQNLDFFFQKVWWKRKKVITLQQNREICYELSFYHVM